MCGLAVYHSCHARSIPVVAIQRSSCCTMSYVLAFRRWYLTTHLLLNILYSVPHNEMATLTEDKVRTASLSSTSSPRNFSKPSAPSSPALRGEPMATALATTPPIPARPFPPPAVVAGVHRGWKPLGFLSILRNVLVKTPFWLTWLRILQSLLAGVVIGCLVWNLTFDDFSGVSTRFMLQMMMSV
jgi:hypothetical protein